jgi:predicted Zn-dependent peptidase
LAAYHVPDSKSAEYPALRVLENVLLSGQSSRLYQRLVDKDQLAISVEGGFSLAMDPTLFIISVQPKEGVDTLKIESALYEELERLGREEIAPRELQKAHNALLADHYRQLKTISGKAQALGNYEVYFGGYKGLFDAPGKYASVGASRVKNAAMQYFKERNRTVATLVPTKEEKGEQKP